MEVISCSDEVRQVHEHVLAGSAMHSRHIDPGAGEQIHVIETGDGRRWCSSTAPGARPVLSPAAGTPQRRAGGGRRSAGTWAERRSRLPRDRFREAAVTWVDRLLDALELDTTALLGHSMGGLWALWYALAHPDRGGTAGTGGHPCAAGHPLPAAVPHERHAGRRQADTAAGAAEPEGTASVRALPGRTGDHRRAPGLIDLLIATAADPVAAGLDLAEVRAIISPFALAQPSGFRRAVRVQPAELSQLAVPALLVWGDHEPLGSVADARAMSDLIPDSRLEVLPGGHAPWLGHPDRAAAVVTGFVAATPAHDNGRYTAYRRSASSPEV